MVRPWGNTSMVFFILLIPTKFVVFSLSQNHLGADWSGLERTSVPFRKRRFYLRGMNLLFH